MADRWREQQIQLGRRRCFLEKKKPKTFAFWVCALLPCPPQEAKVFWFFFSKKNNFLFQLRMDPSVYSGEA